MTLIRCGALLLALGFFSVPAWAADDQVICKDGTTSKGGKGACSGHGGVDKAATTAAKDAEKAKVKAAKDAERAKAKAAKEEKAKAKPGRAEDEEKAAASRTEATVVCRDGTTSKGGKGACSGHGGIDRKAAAGGASGAAAPMAAPPTGASSPEPTAPRAPAPARAGQAPAKAAPDTAPATPANTDPTGAIARCKDGTYSHAKVHSGACSRHGGVAEWLDK